MLDSLKIFNFRVFEDLKIQKLNRVNLITGRNNSGKTSILEALNLYFQAGSPQTIFDILDARGQRVAFRGSDRSFVERVVNIASLFTGFEKNKLAYQHLGIGPVDGPDLLVALRWYLVQPAEEGEESARRIEVENPADEPEAKPFLQISSVGRLRTVALQFDGNELSMPQIRASARVMAEKPCNFVPSGSLDPIIVGRLWDSVALTDFEQKVVEALKLISDNIERISLIADPFTSRSRNVVVKLSDISHPVPLKGMGDGMNRIFGIALALVNSAGGILLIDEIENGLHYSVHSDLWEMIISLANELNIQVFATTHSWDCVLGFQSALSKLNSSDGTLIRIDNKNGKMRSTIFDADELYDVTREKIEVR